MPVRHLRELYERWIAFRRSSRFHDGLVFMAYVAIAALFWLIMALNDSVEDTLEVRINVSNVPDSVTFIQLPPDKVHVSVRDKGTSILRAAFLHTPVVNLNFADYASDGVLRFSRNDMTAAVRGVFGQGAQVSVLSIDSIRVPYTTLKGKRVPVEVSAEVTASLGNVVEGRPVSRPSNVLVYGTREVLDTITRVYTERLVKRSLSESTSVSVAVRPVAGARVVPSSVEVKINVQPLVSKESMVEVGVRGVPEGMSLLLFPSRVPVAYFVPMSHFNNDNPDIEVWVDFADTHIEGTNLLPVHIGRSTHGIRNVVLKKDSVEYTLVHN